MSRGRKNNVGANGRTKTKPFVMFMNDMTASPAWIDLSGNAVKLLIALTKYWNGNNNGELFLGVRDAGSLIGVRPHTAGHAFRELEVHGFIRATQRSAFHVKTRTATVWRLTFHASLNSAPTNEWRDWRRQTTVSKTDTDSVENRHRDGKSDALQCRKATPSPRKTPFLPGRSVSKTDTHIDIPGGQRA